MDAYEQVRYEGQPYPSTFPGHLALLADLHGLTPAPPGSARVLELGCGEGINAVAIAAEHPGATVLGVDRVAAQLERGRAAIAERDLANIRLEVADLSQVTGEYDYVIAHGLYSWAPAEDRDALLATIARVLAPQGVGYVSFNAHPGGHIRRILREAALGRARADAPPAELVAVMRELLASIGGLVANRQDPYGYVMAHEVARLQAKEVFAVAHDELGEHFEPVWIRDFLAHLTAHGLHHVCDAEISDLREPRTHPEWTAWLREAEPDDRVERLQLADLIAGRAFRQAVVCRAEAGAAEDPVKPVP